MGHEQAFLDGKECAKFASGLGWAVILENDNGRRLERK